MVHKSTVGHAFWMSLCVEFRKPSKTNARVQPTTKQRVNLALRLEGQMPGGRLRPSRIHETTPLEISMTRLDDVDAEVLDWLQKAYEHNR